MGLLYRSCVVPVFDRVMAVKPMRKQREKVVPRAQGRVLEVGVGTGLNLEHYDRQRVLRLAALDPDRDMQRLAQRRAREAGLEADWLELEAERIPLDDASVDCVVMTYTLCTIGDPVTALREMRRVLTPEGEVLFSEHGRAPDPDVRRWQRRATPLWKKIAGGCHLDRDIPTLFAEAGLAVDELQTMYLPRTPRMLGYNYWGRAVAC